MTRYIKINGTDVFPRLPLQGNFDITYRCNNNCLHCWLRVPPKSSDRQNELTTDEIKAIVDDARKLGCRNWSISGGEPMLRPDFPEIFDYITKRSSSYSINTNGSLITPEIAELMKRKGRKTVSLYGATAEVHDHITRNPGSFQATMKGFQLLQEAGADFIVQIVPMKYNFHQLEEMRKLAKLLSPFHRISPPCFFTSAKGDFKRNKEIKLQKLEPRDAIELDKPYVPDKEIELESCDCFSESDTLFAPCIGNENDFHIDPYGYMSLCRFIKDPSLRFDLRNRIFRDCWKIFVPSFKDLEKGNKEYRDDYGFCSLRSQSMRCPVYSYLGHKHFSSDVENLCQVAEESNEFKEYWERNHCRYFMCAEITIKIESDLPITEKTFHPTFYPFQIDKPEKSVITIQHCLEMPYLDSNDFGKIVYNQQGYVVYKREDSWIYLTGFKGGYKANTIAVFNKDYTNGRVYSSETAINNVTVKVEDQDSPYLVDIILTQTSLANVLADRGGFFLHSSGIIIGGKGILFVGHSGAGKTTLRNMALLKEEIKPLCNDKNIVRKCPDGFRVYGTWVLTNNLSDVQTKSVPLGALMFLEQAKENIILPLDNRIEVAKRLLSCIIRPVESIEWWNNTLSIIDEITREIPCYRLRFDLTGRITDQIEHICHW